MDVKGIGSGAGVPNVSKTRSVSPGGVEHQRQTPGVSSTVDISTAEPPLDTRKLDAIKASIENGTYRADPQGIAKSILAKGR